MADLDSVRVAVRIRPLSNSEKERNSKVAVEKVPSQPQIKVNRTDNFTFNFVFDVDSTQDEVYKSCVSNMLDKLFEGFNATILAYGQTGSGKTFTMGTHFDGELDDYVGVIPRAMVDIFERIDKLAGEIDFNVKCSFMELYNEQLFDLLSNKSRVESVVDMREDRTGIIIPGLTEEMVTTAQETTDFLAKGSAGRAVASTAMNEQSSRSHAIFTLSIQATNKNDVNSVTTSKFHLVDLAGSERSKKTKASGDRFKEGIKINQSLMVLGKVISALGTNQGNGFVCYRDSKLTRFLQDSLGGNSYTLMIACVSPAEFNVDETLSTLRYADNARKIKNKPIVNQDPRVAEINFLKDLSRRLYMECTAGGLILSANLAADIERIQQGGSKSHLGSKTASYPSTTMLTSALSINSVEFEALQLKYAECLSKCNKLQQTLQVTLHDLAEAEMRAHLNEAANENLQNKSEQIGKIVKALKEKYPEDAEVLNLFNVFNEINEYILSSQSEIREYKNRCSVSSDMEGTSSEYNHTDAQEETEAFTNKQSALNEALRRIDRELILKQQLHDKVKNNFSKFYLTELETESEQVKEFEQKIKDLESEKQELMEKLKNVKDTVSAKLAEERRKRLQDLEHQITAMKRKVDQQAKLLKVREKEAEKIKNLNVEIRGMKESKVKLIREMRKESEKFRLSKMEYEKKVIQLKNKDRKLQAEMTKKEALHNKQRNVLKRKCEEAMAVNKRLKDALERQSAAQASRHKYQATKNVTTNTSTKLEQFLAASERELEIITSLVDAKFSLEQLIEYRKVISNRINELQTSDDPGNEEELKSLRDDLEVRNGQISDLQQKVTSADLDGRIKSLVESIQNVADGKAVLGNLVKLVCEIRRENAQLNQNLNNIMDEQKATEERYSQAAKRMRLMEIEFEDKLMEKENSYEDKIAVLLRELHKTSETMEPGSDSTANQREFVKIQEEQLNKMEQMKEELDYYKKLTEDLANAANKIKGRKTTTLVKQEPIEEIVEDIDDDDDEPEIYDDVDDPDWSRTPRFRRHLSNNNRRRNRTMNSSDSNSIDETFTTATTSETTTTNIIDKKKPTFACKCTGKCSSRRCGCFGRDLKCSDSCRCGEACINGEKGKSSKENMPPPAADFSELIQVKMENTENEVKAYKPSELFKISVSDTAVLDYTDRSQTPKIQKLSIVPFNTPSIKKRFLD